MQRKLNNYQNVVIILFLSTPSSYIAKKSEKPGWLRKQNWGQNFS